MAFLLDAGIAKWSDVRRTFNASARRPAKYVGDRLRALEAIWLEVGATFQGSVFLQQRGCRDADPAMLAKYASVALLGVWGRREYFRYRLVTTSCDEDSRSEGLASCSPTPGSTQEGGVSVFRDIITKQRVLDPTSMRPVHQRCLEEERLQITRGRLIILRWTQPQYLLSFRVDEVFCRIAKGAGRQTQGVRGATDLR